MNIKTHCDIIHLATVYKVVASRTANRREVVLMVTIYEVISLMIAFGMLLIALLTYIDRDNKRK